MRRKKAVSYKKRAINMLIAAGALAAFLALLLILRTNTSVSEWMASNVSRGWISVFSRITGIFPFSLYETFLYVAIIGGIALTVAAIVFFCKKNAARAVTYLLVILLIGVSFGDIYTLTAGFAYYRGDVDVPYYDSEFLGDAHKEELLAVVEYMMEDFNAVSALMERDEEGRTISPYTHRELSDKLKEEFKRLDSDYFSSFTPSAKKITSKNIMSNMHITGVFFAPFGEANVNPNTPASDMPVTMAHELAHAKGVMRESDANLVAYWLTITSDDPYLRYSGYNACYYKLLSVVSFYDSHSEDKTEDNYMRLLSMMDRKIVAEELLNYEFWEKFKLLDKITEAFNDFYLKLQGQKDGTGSYVEPTLPPGEIVTPNPNPGGDVGGSGGDKVEYVYNLNYVQRMILRAVTERKQREVENG